MISIRSSFIIAFTEIIKDKLVHPRFSPPPVLRRHDHQCPEDQPFSLVTHDRKTTPFPTFHPQAKCYEKTLKMIDITNDPDCLRAGRHCELKKADVKKCDGSGQFSASSLLSGTSLILSLSQIRTGSTPWLLVLRSHGIRFGRAPSRSFELTSSDTYRAESQEASSTLSRRRNPRLWRLATRRSPHIIPGKGNHVFQYSGSILF